MADSTPQPSSGVPFERPAAQQAPQEDVPLPAVRADLQISPQLYLGKTVYVAKDPVSLSYFRLQPAEHYVLLKLDGRTTAKQVAEMVNHRFRDQQTTPEDVVSFVRMLQGNGLLVGRGQSHGRYLRSIRDNRRKRRRRAALLGFMYAKLPLIDPDTMLEWLTNLLRPVLNRFWLWVSVLFMLVTAAAVLLQAPRFSGLAFPVLGWQNLLLLSVTFFVVKVVHEFGHGLAAKMRGLEVHEMGVLLMVFLPMYYVDVTDAWMVPRRRDRLWITAGGVFIEFLFAAIAAWVWLATEPGIVNQVAFNVLLAASITTFVFNINPLLRYDGYYFLMDWLEIPNLRTKATQYLAYLAKRYLLGMPDVTAPPEAARKPIFMPIYAITSSIYRVMVVFGIITLVWHILDPYGLEAIGSMLGMFALVTSVIWPAFKMVRFVFAQQARTWRRALTTLAGAAALGAIAWAILLIPIEQTVEHPAVTLAPHRQPIYAPVTGRVTEVFVTNGASLRAGDPILRLGDEELTDKLKLARLERRLVELERRKAHGNNKPDAVQVLTNRLVKIDKDIDHFATKIEELTVRAPISGRLALVQAPQRTLGLHVKQGEDLGLVIGHGAPTVAIVVPQADASAVRAQMETRVRLWGDPRTVYVGRLRRIGTQFLESLPHEALSARYGGEVDILDSSGYKSTPGTRSVLAEVVFDGQETGAPTLPDGVTGRGKVVLGRSTLGHTQWRTIRQALSLDWWL